MVILIYSNSNEPHLISIKIIKKYETVSLSSIRILLSPVEINVRFFKSIPSLTSMHLYTFWAVRILGLIVDLSIGKEMSVSDASCWGAGTVTPAPSPPQPTGSPNHPMRASSLPAAEKLLLTADLLVVRTGRCAADKGAEARDGKLTASHDFKGSPISLGPADTCKCLWAEITRDVSSMCMGAL